MKEPIVNIAVRAARLAGNIIARSLDRLDTIIINEKSPNDYVTDIDQYVEREIIAVIRKAFPRHGILGEESGEIAGGDFQWIIDPIDGTRNFIHGFPHFAVSIAVRQKDKIEHGVIYDPMRQDLFTASRGKGAYLNDRRIRVSKKSQFADCLLSSNFNRNRLASVQDKGMTLLQAVNCEAGAVRSGGAASLDLAYVAAGRLDGFWDTGLKIWDMAAGILLIKEAGGLVTDFSGTEDVLAAGNVVAGNAKILKQLLKIIQSHI